MSEQDTPQDFEDLLQYLKMNRGIDFTGYKRSTLMRRIHKRMERLGLQDYAAYQDYLEADPPEINELLNTILVNVTSFFRDRASWEYVQKKVFPRLLESKKDFEQIRIWSACCASGQEPYTIAMILAEILGPQEMVNRVKIYGTDIDEEALTTARQGVYTSKEIADVPQELVEKYFYRKGDQYAFSRDLRRALVFGRHDLLQDVPISQIDFLSCRNALMYFNSESQGKILKRLHFALADNGFLFLGKAEMLLLRSKDFESVDVRYRVFTRSSRSRQRDRLLMASQIAHDHGPDNDLNDGLLRLTEMSFDQDPLAQLLVDNDGMLAMANRTARKLFKISPSHIGQPFKDLEMSYRPVELHSLGRQVKATQIPIIIRDIEFHVAQGDVLNLSLHVAALTELDGTVIGVRYVFTDNTRLRNLQLELENRKQELETAYEELQSSNEELTTTNEELQSTVEELETTNEELQSTNEELETMNEELQSTNEELETINSIMDQKNHEVHRLNAFLQSILGGLQAGVVVVGNDMKVLVWNKQCENLWGLRSEEAEGEHIFNLDIRLPLEQLRPYIKNCLTGQEGQPEKVIEATNRRGKAVRVSARCTPLNINGHGNPPGVLIMIQTLDDLQKVEK